MRCFGMPPTAKPRFIMLDFGWSEFFLIIVLGIVLIGPKDIPGLVYQAGRFVRRVQYMRFALTKQFDTFMEQNDLDELRRGGGLGNLKGDVRAALNVPLDGVEDEDDEVAFHDAIPLPTGEGGARASAREGEGKKKRSDGSQLSLGLPLETHEDK
jgi:sec-independent protein translocase protein TatB